ncbi:dihydropteroate synthase [Phragmitibacter flavus]|uniref:dihydropteroate synthase n=2 Tax=Phragmitibacter flavus TaxID=2576071 RepID=A0A5R8KKS4_9BACT|nr:dihydropteroate synthase [Phragmitibacter flavus]
MGIININDDSFCNDGSLDPTTALAQARQQLIDGADIIDIGAESARTNRGPISIEEEVRRLRSFIDQWPDLIADLPASPPLLSINTWRSEVVEQILPHGGDILNDISALPDARNAELCAQHGAALLIMHSVGQPKVAHTHVGWPDIMAELDRFFEEKIQLAIAAGLNPNQIILDPGIDFAKQRDDNLTIYRDLEKLHRFNRPILLPVSRKTVIGNVLNLPDPNERDAGTLACIATGVRRGAHIFRVHNVPAVVQSLKILTPLMDPVAADVRRL